MLILLPDGRIHRLTLPFLRISFREAPLTATLLAALTPPELGFDIRICDASVSDVPMDGTFDLVAISIITGTAIEGYRLADHFRAKGATVVIGGVHATLLPDEAAAHADSLMTGFAEGTWPEMCRDFCNGALKPRYDGGSPDLVGIPWPRSPETLWLHDAANRLRHAGLPQHVRFLRRRRREVRLAHASR